MTADSPEQTEREAAWGEHVNEAYPQVINPADVVLDVRREGFNAGWDARAAGRAEMEVREELVRVTLHQVEVLAGARQTRIEELEGALRWAHDELRAWFDGPEWEGIEMPEPTCRSMEHIRALLPLPAEGPEASEGAERA